MITAAQVWHYWVSYALVGGAALAIVATGIGYLLKVVSARYPKQ